MRQVDPAWRTSRWIARDRRSPGNYSWWQGFGLNVDTLWLIPGLEDNANGLRELRFLFVSAGWPSVVLECSATAQNTFGRTRLWSVRDGWVAPDTMQNGRPPYDGPGRVLPLRVRWSGVMFNTGCYLAVFLSIRLPIRVFIRWRRDVNGLCRYCGYNLGFGLPPHCPECGRSR
jgi:hypothetical protein